MKHLVKEITKRFLLFTWQTNRMVHFQHHPATENNDTDKDVLLHRGTNI